MLDLHSRSRHLSHTFFSPIRAVSATVIVMLATLELYIQLCTVLPWWLASPLPVILMAACGWLASRAMNQRQN